jgi:hypothetical protein
MRQISTYIDLKTHSSYWHPVSLQLYKMNDKKTVFNFYAFISCHLRDHSALGR